MDVLHPIVIDRAEGALITDVDGNTLIDFAGGVGVMNVGHSDPRVLAAIHAQVDRFTHTDYTVLPYEVYVAAAERLLEKAPFAGPAKAAFFNSGAEAVENAVKFARAYTDRPAVIAFDGGFHGRTLMALSLTSKTHPYKAGLGPFAPEVYRAPFPYQYRGISSQDALEAFEKMLLTQVAAETVAAVIVEPVQGEGGFIPASPRFISGLRKICDREGIVLIFDEVQTGFGRTGRFFASEHYDVEPDLITIAKSVAAGIPLSGVLGKAEIMDAPVDGGVGGTYVGNPVALAAAAAVLDVFEQDNLVKRAQVIGRRCKEKMSEWAQRHPQIGDVRGIGAMVALELVRDPVEKTPAPELAEGVIEAARVRGLLLLRAGIYSNCLRVLSPLSISDELLEEALDVWEVAIDNVLS